MSTTYTDGGPGRKKCECGVFVAARTNTCPKCGHVFVSRTAVLSAVRDAAPVAGRLLEEDETEGAALVKGKEALLVPAGRCPIPLEGTSRAEVQEWTYFLCDALPDHALTRFAAMQFLRQFHPYGSAEFEEAISHLPHCRSLFADPEFDRFWKGRQSVAEGASPP